MSYTKQTWNIGETLSADKLNHLENGVENKFMVVVFEHNIINDTITASESFNDAKTAILNGIPVFCNIHAFNDSNETDVIEGPYLIAYYNEPDSYLLAKRNYQETYKWYADRIQCILM